MSAWITRARQVTNLARLSSPKSAYSTPQSSTLIPRRGLASGGGDHHGPPKVNFWEDPMNPSKWKEEHFVIVSLTGCGLLFYGGYKYFISGKNEAKKEEVGTVKSSNRAVRKSSKYYVIQDRKSATIRIL
ncbi:hypothetical protein REPUB_Repub05bG0052800 [Reevesia pubescens]